MRNRRGFTMIELMIVIIIIIILATAALALMNTFFRGQGVRQGAMIVSQAVAQAKQRAAETHRYVFLVFSKLGEEAWLEIHEDTNLDGIYQGDQDNRDHSKDGDKAIEGHQIDLPKHIIFDKAPVSITFAPSGFIGGYKDVPASQFDGTMNGNSPKAEGDVILRVKNQKYLMCMDLEQSSGKIRRMFFLDEGQ